jgi:hypothetical protein
MKRIHVFTSAACNYIPKARVLVESIRQNHPDWRIHLALADEIPDGLDFSTEPFDEIHPLSTLDIPHYRAWAFCHSLVELATAIKPFLLKKLLERDDCAGVVYLDPDIVMFSPLEEVLSALEVANIVLTPHQITPESTLGAIMDNEICSLKHGIYNLGFLAVAPSDTGKGFAEWWSSRTYHFCRADIKNGLFTDQRWIDLVPAFFEGICILRSPRLNVAPWNLTTRQLFGDMSKGFTINGDPLGFYHFTGFDSGDHQVMANINGTDSSGLQQLIDWYQRVTRTLEHDALSSQAWAYGNFEDGTTIPVGARIVYRERIDLQTAFTDPFAFSKNSYQSWYFNQGPKEYPELFDQSLKTPVIDRLSAVLSPGFQAGATTPINIARVTATMVKHLRQPSRITKTLQKSIEILRTEGFKGITKRLQ